MREWSKAHGGLVAAVAALSLAVVAVILLVSPPVARTSLEDSGYVRCNLHPQMLVLSRL
jgi:hypothetical protein